MTRPEDAKPRPGPDDGPTFELASYGLIALGVAGPFASAALALAITGADGIREVGGASRAFRFAVATIPYSALLVVAGIGVRSHRAWGRPLGIVLTSLGGLSSIGSLVRSWTSGALGSRFLSLAVTALFAVVFASLLRMGPVAVESSPPR